MRPLHTLGFALPVLLLAVAGRAEPLPELVVDRPGMVVTASARVVIPPGTVLPGVDGPALLVGADDLTIEFADGSVLRGADPGVTPDTIAGTGLLIDGRKNVRIRNFEATGYKVALRASGADGLRIEGANITDLWRPRLRSTPQREDAGDWLWPHKNDDGQWARSYGAAVVVERATGVRLSDITVRRSQNGIILDRVNDSRVFDCDASFLSGWGLAMWRSGGNTVSRNAFDFCVRGYSHGVYNRGQDSAGILLFEQCSRNMFVENSATHSGDGVFGFAGREALGEDLAAVPPADAAAVLAADSDVAPGPEDRLARHRRAGCNDNLFLSNDLSYAVAHGLEMTFSFGNRIISNRLVGSAMTGCWLGYSAQTLVSGNLIGENGGFRAPTEGGGVLIEHGRDNRIVNNTFDRNTIAVSLWANHPSKLEALPWGLANAEPGPNGAAEGDAQPALPRIPSARTLVAGNRFDKDRVALKLRQTRQTAYYGNTISEETEELDAEPGTEVDLTDRGPVGDMRIDLAPPGARTPVGARAFLEGRQNIIMGEWGPWDHQSVLVREFKRSGAEVVYEVFGVRGPIEATIQAGEVDVAVESEPDDLAPDSPKRTRVRVRPKGPGLTPFSVALAGTGLDRTLSGTLVSTPWKVSVWNFTADPIADPDAWRAESRDAKTLNLDRLDLVFAYSGPAGQPDPALKATNVGGTRFGLVATTRVSLKPGRYTLSTLSDDGLRVLIDGKPVVERWDIHVPTLDSAVFIVEEAREVPVRVEYFQVEGFATLKIDIEPAP